MCSKHSVIICWHYYMLCIQYDQSIFYTLPGSLGKSFPNTVPHSRQKLPFNYPNTYSVYSWILSSYMAMRRDSYPTSEDGGERQSYQWSSSPKNIWVHPNADSNSLSLVLWKAGLWILRKIVKYLIKFHPQRRLGFRRNLTRCLQNAFDHSALL